MKCPDQHRSMRGGQISAKQKHFMLGMHKMSRTIQKSHVC